MSPRTIGQSLALLILAAGGSLAQGGAGVIQLPTFKFFTASTTVSVPDRGGALLGGVSSIREGSTERGVPILGSLPGAGRLFKNRAIGREVGTSMMSVHARIISLEEEEERQVGRVLAARGRRGGGLYADDPATNRKAAFLASHVGRRGEFPVAPRSEPKLPSVEEIRQRNLLAQRQRDAEAVEYFDKGQAAEARGKFATAKIFYNMAARRAQGDFKRQVFAQLNSLSGGGETAELAVSRP